MPLKCVADGLDVFSFDFPDTQDWERLRKINAQSSHLTMACCDAAVVLKTSQLGTRYFAHAKKGECATAPETSEHLLAKAVIASAIKRAGWHAVTEQAGETPQGDRWIADVMALPDDEENPIAFEVQWSPQTLEETDRRQARYQASNVMGFWLMRQHNLPRDSETPAFRLVFDKESKRFEVWIPCEVGKNYMISSSNQNDPSHWRQRIELGRFVEGVLRGCLLFAPHTSKEITATMFAAEDTCWRCKKRTKIFTHLKFNINQVIPEFENASIDLPDFSSSSGDARAETMLNEVLPAALLASRGVGNIKRRYSNTVKTSYLSNGCVHCDALQGNYFIQQLRYHAKPTASFIVPQTPEWFLAMNIDRKSNFWWFDEAFAATFSIE